MDDKFANADMKNTNNSKVFDEGLAISGSGNNRNQQIIPQIMLNSRNSNPLKKCLPIKLYINVSIAKVRLKKVYFRSEKNEAVRYSIGKMMHKQMVRIAIPVMSAGLFTLISFLMIRLNLVV